MSVIISFFKNLITLSSFKLGQKKNFFNENLTKLLPGVHSEVLNSPTNFKFSQFRSFCNDLRDCDIVNSDDSAVINFKEFISNIELLVKFIENNNLFDEDFKVKMISIIVLLCQLEFKVIPQALVLKFNLLNLIHIAKCVNIRGKVLSTNHQDLFIKNNKTIKLEWFIERTKTLNEYFSIYNPLEMDCLNDFNKIIIMPKQKMRYLDLHGILEPKRLKNVFEKTISSRKCILCDENSTLEMLLQHYKTVHEIEFGEF